MKKLLLLIPLLMMSGCSYDKVYTNVDFHYESNENIFIVKIDKKHIYKVPKENYHEVQVEELEVYNGSYVHNRFYIKWNTLYNYFTECCAVV